MLNIATIEMSTAYKSTQTCILLYSDSLPPYSDVSTHAHLVSMCTHSCVFVCAPAGVRNLALRFANVCATATVSGRREMDGVEFFKLNNFDLLLKRFIRTGNI